MQSQEEQNFSTTITDASHIFGSATNYHNALSSAQIVLSQFSDAHPSFHLSRLETTDTERQNINIQTEYGDQIVSYLKQLELNHLTQNFLHRHQITESLRSRMVDWMVEVLSNFKCEDQTFFLSVALLDRFLTQTARVVEVSNLHIIGVTSMFIASKFEDIHPLKMKIVFEKIGHQKLTVESIKQLELDILKTLHYKIASPTVLEFLLLYLKQVLNIDH
jgi:cyclin-A